ncbi:unnamed protein product [Brugia pahangi]|uniref:ACT domain-containing protein n=1 Tax=Brugia pahangi TaxID=6280 RepID=A0A0N4TJS0_BRUPA|nr:unnamed protein product [Brugia pahangi]
MQKTSLSEINVIVSNSTDAFCFMLELPGGSQPVKTEKILDILGTDNVIITDLKPETTLKEVDDLSYLGVAPEAKRTVRIS